MTHNRKQNDTFKYQLLYDWITAKINDGTFPYDTKLPSEASLCTQFQISRQTVRNALTQLCNDGYIESLKGSGSYVRKSIAGRERNIGVLFTTIGDYINSNILSGLQEVFTRKGYSILIDLSHNRIVNETRFLQKMLNSNISGLIMEGSKSTFPTPNEELYSQFIKKNIPIVFVNNYYSNLNFPSVTWDDRQISYDLTTHLIHSGRKQIAGMFKFDEMQGVERYTGYIKALMDNNMEIREDLIEWHSDTNLPANVHQKERTFKSFAKYISSNCDALICYNDLVACSLIRSLMLYNVSIPDQLLVASFDNSDVTKLYGIESLPSVNHPKEGMGKQAADLLLYYIENPNLNFSESKNIKMPATADGCDRLML